MSSLVSRVTVAVIAVPAVLGIVWLGGWWLFALAALVAVVALHEFAALTRPLRPLVLAGYVGVIAMLLATELGGIPWLLGSLMGTLLLAFVLQGLVGTRQAATIAIGSTMLGASWIGLGLAHVLLLRDLADHGRLAVITVLLAVWASNTMAFFTGRLVGRHKLAPILSPGKTWEGFIAGTIGAIAVVFFALYEDRDTFLNIPEALVLGGVIALSAVLGDLFESALKRDAEVKDSGRVLAGHGGVLDAIDALLFAAPASFYLILAFGHHLS